MSRVGIKWALLFFFSIFLPVSILSYLSLQSLQDERQSVLEDQQLMAALLRESFDRLVGKIAEKLTYADPPTMDLPAFMSFPEVAQSFAVDATGAFLYPRFRPLAIHDRRPLFASLLHRGELLEFQQRNYAAAIQAYWEAWKETRSEAEGAEVLNAIAGCALKAGNGGLATELHQKLTFYNLTFDADGAHPLTLSYLRLARYLGPERGIALLSEWARATLSGHYPLYPGCRRALAIARELATQWPEQGQRLLPDLERVESQVDFVERFAAILKTNLTRGTGYLSGTQPDGESFLIYVRSFASGEAVGLLFDLGKVHEALARSQVGASLESRGLEFTLFDVDRESAFASQRQGTISTVAPASQGMERLRLGLYTRDASSAMGHYRRRNLLIFSGIFALAGFVVLGAYLIFRDTVREVRLARLRSEFVANVSHELRTPLTAIRMYAETLLAGRFRSPEKQGEYLGKVLHESERLSRLVDNVLAFSQVESRRKSYEFQDCDLGEIVRLVLDSFAPLLSQRGFDAAVHIPDSLPPVRADRDAMAMAIANLVSNAVKYSPQRRELGVAVREQDSRLIVEVADRGIGVPPGEHQRIFAKYHRAANAADIASGTGIGLALTRSIAEAHGGKVEVRDREGGGSVFLLLVPKAGG